MNASARERPAEPPPGDYYAVLKVARTADGGEIRAAYRARFAELDTGGLKGRERVDRMRQLADALTVLGHAERRRIYDKYGCVPDLWEDGNPAERRFALGGVFCARTLLIGVLSSALTAWLLAFRIEEMRPFSGALSPVGGLSGRGLFSWAFVACFFVWDAGLLAVAGGQLLALQFLKRVNARASRREAEIAYYLMLLLVVIPAGRAFKALFSSGAGVSPADFGASGVFSWVDAIWITVCVFSYERIVWHQKERPGRGNFLV